MDEPLIDVLIAVYNSAGTVRASVESIQHQTLRNIHIVIVDDGSTDGTREILQEIAAADPRVRIICKAHSGIVESLNRGLAECSAEFLARFDGDDIAYPHRFESQVAYLRAHPSCLAVASSAIHIDAHDVPTGTIAEFAALESADPAWIPAREPYLLQPFLMLRKSSIDAVHGYRLCEVAEDADLYWRLSEIGELRNTTDILGAYRLNPASISSKSILNGRRMALCPQLIGISALRRKLGAPDISFDRQRIDAYTQATSLAELCRLGSAELSPAELVRLRIAAAVKLLELTSYRPYELDREDCRFIKAAIAEGSSLLNPENRAEVEGRLIEALQRMLRKRNFDGMLLLGSPKLYLKTVYRSVFPAHLRLRLKSALRPGAAQS